MRITDTKKVTIGGHDFWIHPFGAMTAANISGDVIKIAVILGDLRKAAFGGADSELTSALNGNEIERIFRELLLDKKNIAVDFGTEQGVWLTENILNEWFAGDVVDMYLLAWEVIKVNYSDFFGKLSKAQSGNAPKAQSRTK